MSAGKSEIGNSVTFAYFTALQAEAYSFYRIPNKMLIFCMYIALQMVQILVIKVIEVQCVACLM